MRAHAPGVARRATDAMPVVCVFSSFAQPFCRTIGRRKSVIAFFKRCHWEMIWRGTNVPECPDISVLFQRFFT